MPPRAAPALGADAKPSKQPKLGLVSFWRSSSSLSTGTSMDAGSSSTATQPINLADGEGLSLTSPSTASRSQDDASSVPSSAAALQRKLKEKDDGPYEVKVKLHLRVLSGGHGIVTNMSLVREQLKINKVARRNIYTADVKKRVIEEARTTGLLQAVKKAKNRPGYGGSQGSEGDYQWSTYGQ